MEAWCKQVIDITDQRCAPTNRAQLSHRHDASRHCETCIVLLKYAATRHMCNGGPVSYQKFSICEVTLCCVCCRSVERLRKEKDILLQMKNSTLGDNPLFVQVTHGLFLVNYGPFHPLQVYEFMEPQAGEPAKLILELGSCNLEVCK